MHFSVRDFAVAIPATKIAFLPVLASGNFGQSRFVTPQAIFLHDRLGRFRKPNRLLFRMKRENRGMTQAVMRFEGVFP